MRELADWRKSHRGIRRRLRGVVLIPSVTLLAMWAVVSSFSLYDGIHTRAVASGVQDVSVPAVGMLSSAQKERGLSLVALSGSDADQRALQQQRQQTDRAAAAMHAAADPMLDRSPDEVRQRAARLNEVLGQLSELRDRVDAEQVDRNEVYGFYNGFVDAGSDLFEVQARNVPDYEAGQTALRGAELFRHADRMSRASALVADGISAGQLGADDQAEVARLVGSYRFGLQEAAESALPAVREHYRGIADGPEFTRLAGWEQQVINAGGSAAVDIDGPAWTATSDRVSDELNALAVEQVTAASNAALDYGNANLLRVAAGSLAALAATVVAIAVATRASRRISHRLDDLREATLELSGDQLPTIVDRLRRGDRVEVETALPNLDYGTDEIGQVADAFNIAQRTAVSAAVQESQAREGVNTVFLGIAHRSQALVHRQLRVLDKLERSVEDPDQVELLFQLDHLATRSRRNAENLIILGGKQPGRRWNKPVKLVDVLRSAIAETKHYARVRMHHPPELSIVGNAVADTIHLVAELVDNATSFSPPNSRVAVSSQLVARGLVVEVEDHGLGIEDAELEAANEVLRDPPEFDAVGLQSDARLGLFVVARLAARHDIGIELRSSPYGGTRAIVLLPTQLTATQQDPDKDDPRTARIPRISTAPELRGGAPAPEEAGSPAGPVSVAAENGRGAESSADAGSSADGGSAEAAEEVAEHEWPPAWPEAEDWPAVAEEPAAEATGSAVPSARRADSDDRTAGEVRDEPSTQDWPLVDSHSSQQSSRPPLPRRRRQAHLAPQLAQDQSASAGDESEPTRSPEQIRGLMSAFQQGTNRGRHAGGPAEAASPSTTSEE